MGEVSRRDLPAPRPGADELASMYRIAYDQGVRALDDQATEIDGMRTRAVSFMAFVGTATAFLVTTTLRAAQPGTAFYVVAIAATALIAWAILELYLLIAARTTFTLRMDARTIVAEWIDYEVPVPSEAILLRELGTYLADCADANGRGLASLRRHYVRIVTVGSVGLLAWGVAVWAFGSVGMSV